MFTSLFNTFTAVVFIFSWFLLSYHRFGWTTNSRKKVQNPTIILQFPKRAFLINEIVLYCRFIINSLDFTFTKVTIVICHWITGKKNLFSCFATCRHFDDNYFGSKTRQFSVFLQFGNVDFGRKSCTLLGIFRLKFFHTVCTRNGIKKYVSFHFFLGKIFFLEYNAMKMQIMLVKCAVEHHGSAFYERV